MIDGGRLAAVTLALALGACQAAPESNGGPPAEARAGVGGAGGGREAPAASASSAKPTAPIAIRYELGGEPQVGRMLAVTITVAPQGTMSAFTLELTPGAGLLLAPPTDGLQAAEVSADRPFVRTVSVTPLEEGALRLGVVAVGELSGQRQARSITISIRVGAARAADRAEAQKTDESGESLVVLPAREKP